MRISVALLGVGTALCLAVTPVSAIASRAPSAVPAPAALATECAGTTACWQMDEPAGAAVMVDSSGNGLNGNIEQPNDQITTNGDYYHWLRKGPNQLPVQTERIIQVPDSSPLDLTDASQTYTVELRYRTKENFGNITQKGQATTKGGQFKIQNPQGRPSCLFKGALGRVSTRSTVALNDEAWHVLTCVRAPTRVTLLIDGVANNYQNGSTGVINNAIPLTIGGKINCNQMDITCDYFSGDIDWVRIFKT